MKKKIIAMTFFLTVACLFFTACAQSSYELAVKNGFVGSETEWLESLRGEKGEEGEKGDPGEAGRDGADGADGAAWFSGNGTPASSLGKTGDYYLDFTDGSVYEKTAIGWTKKGELKIEPSDDADKGGNQGGVGDESKQTVTITFDEGNDIKHSRMVTKGESMDLPTPQREGYVFLGWFYGAGVNMGQATDLTPFTRDMTLTAKWREKYGLIPLNEGDVEAELGVTTSLMTIYSGTANAEYNLYLEKDGERRDGSAGHWLSGYSIGVEEGRGSYMTLLSLTFSETGEYRVILTATEDGDTVEVAYHITVSE